MQKVYIVRVQGWGDSEDEFYNCGAFSTRQRADAHVQVLLETWAEDGGDPEDVVYDIEVITVDA